MIRVVALAVMVLSIVVPVAGQGPDIAPYVAPINAVLGQVVPPVLNQTYALLGQNITREDVRIFADLNFTKASFNLMGVVLGSGNAEIQASIHTRLEMRVISSERIRAAIEGENAYNMSADNATFLSQVYIPADVFRASLTAEAVAAFQEDQEAKLGAYLAQSVPELDILSLKFAWKNTEPQKALTDYELTEPPIVCELDLVVQYLRVESIPSLLSGYLNRDGAKTGKSDYVKELKAENSDPLRSRDFFAAAAYTQLLNLSMQPGWSLDMDMRVPRGFSFTYANEQVERHSPRHISLYVENAVDEATPQGAAEGAAQHDVYLASITQKRAVALALFGAMWLVGLVLAFPGRYIYARRRLTRLVDG